MASKDKTDVTYFSFEATDFKDRLVYLPPGRWEHHILPVHPDVKDYEQAVQEVAIDPDLVGRERGITDVEIHASYGVGKGVYAKKYLWVPIKYMKGGGLVLTAHWTPQIKTDVIDVEWRRKKK